MSAAVDNQKFIFSGELEDEYGPYGNEGDDLDLAAILVDEEQ